MDDEDLDRQAVVRALQRAAQIDGIEAEVLEADSIASARDALQRDELSCVFLDHDLPDGTALDLIMEVRAQGLNTPVIVLTGQRDEQIIAEVMRAGGIDYLPKERLHPDLIARSLQASLLFQQSQSENQTLLDELHTRDRAIAAASNGITLADPSQPDCPLVYVNEAFLRMTGYSTEEVLGRNCRFLQGEDTDSHAVTELREAIRQERTCHVSFLNYRKDGSPFWNEVTVSPVRNVRGDLTHFVGVQADVTARHEADAERRRSENALRRSQEDLQMAVEGARLGTFYCDWPLEKMIWNDIGKGHFFLPPDAEIDFDLFYLLLHPDDRAPTRRAIERAMAERSEYDMEYRALSSDGRTRWINAVGRFYYGSDGNPVRFDGITIDISARKATEKELRGRAERKELLNRIGQALRDSSNPEAAQETAVALLGEALGADRCYFALYDLVGGVVRIARDWHRKDLPSVQGIHPFVNTAEMFHELYRDANTSVISDAQASSLSAQTLTNMESLQIRSRISVALADSEGLAATLTAAMADEPRDWTPEEVALVEEAATPLRMGVEAARLQKREHRIAEQLQAALQPELPGTVPGLQVTKYYEAALTDEAGVGGDFYDVFALDKGCTALALGDLSGKGLEAAANVSIVRNMLRAFMYSQPTVVAAVNELNRVLAENNLLTGFSTLFVSVYDSGTHLLRYVNAGQEPALLRRAATGLVEQFMPTGPILGSIENAQYTEATISLAAGDALAIFSDGLTEVGPTRSTMLGIEGVTTLFEKPMAEAKDQDAAGVAEHLILRLIEGVDAAAAGGVMRDDVCLLIAVVE